MNSHRILHATIFYLFLVALFVCSSVTSNSQTWTSVTSPTGFKLVRDLMIDNTGDKLYAADAVNLLKSTDNGQTWSATSSAIANPIAVTCKYDNTDTVLVSGSSFFKRSVNGGSSWSDLLGSTTNKPTALANFPLSTRLMLLGREYGSSSERGLARSTDAGATWIEELSSTYKPRINDIAVNLTTVDVAYSDHAIAAGSPNGAVATGRGLFYTENYGDTWVARETAAGDPDWTAVAFVYDLIPNPDVKDIWAGTANGEVWYGDQWEEVTMVKNTNFPPGHNFQDTVRDIQIDKNNYSIVYVVTDKNIYKTTNKGTSWTCIYSSPMTDSRGYALEINPANSSKLVFGTRGFIYRSTDAGSTWSNISSGATRTLSLASVAPNGSSRWAASNDLTLGMKYDGSTLSTLRLGHKDSTFFAKHSATWVNGSGTRYIFHSGVQDDRMMVYFSEDNGASYRIHDDFKYFPATGKHAQGIVADPSLPSKAFAYGSLDNGSGSNRNYFKTTNYGLTWDRSEGPPTNEAWLVISPLGDGQGDGGSSKFVFAGVEGRGLYRSQNSGSNWYPVSTTSIPSGQTVTAVACNPNAPTIAYAGVTGTGGGLFYSTTANDGTENGTGVTFAKTWPSSGNTSVKKVLVDPRFTAASYLSGYVFWVASDNTIYRSENNGTTASSVFGTLPSGTVINDLRSDPSDATLLYLATDRGVYKAQLATTPSLTSPATGATNIVYCNDLIFQWTTAVGATTYDFQLDDNSDFSSTLVNTNQASTQYTYTPDLICGTQYYWRVRSSDGTNFGKSPWTEARSFTTLSCSPAAPTLSAPAHSSTNILYCITSTEPLVFFWSSVTCATDYRFQLDDNSDFSSTLVNTLTSNATQYSYASDLTCGTTYYWKVAAKSGIEGSFSSTFSFTTSACSPSLLSAPTLDSPANGATGISAGPTFSWISVNGAIKYKLVLVGVTTKYVTGTSTAIGGLAYNTWYSWNVTAINCNGSNPASETWTFRTASGPEGPEGPQTRRQDEVDELATPSSYHLAQNYPNPYNPTTRFDYGVPVAGNVRLRIFNALGQVVATLVDEHQSSGYKSVDFDASHLPSGLYFYRLEAGRYTDVKKMLLLK